MSPSTSIASADSPLGIGHQSLSEEPWFRTRIGLATIGLDVALTVALALATAGVFVDWTVDLGATGVPLAVYAFSLLGALGFVFTALVERFDTDTARVLRYNLRLPAALPLGAGVFVLSETILGPAASPALVIGLVFLSGLYVNLAYKRLGALARRLLPSPRAESDRTGERSPAVRPRTTTASASRADGETDGGTPMESETGSPDGPRERGLDARH